MLGKLRFFIKSICLVLVASIILGFSGLGINIFAQETEETEIRLSVDKCVLKPGKKLRLHVENATDPKIVWVSGNKEVATVSKLGKITGISEGRTRIIAFVTTPDYKDGKKPLKLKCKVRIEEEKRVKIAAVGDALIHENILKSGKKSDGSYNYDALFKNVKDHLSEFDVKVINQETIFVKDSSKYAGYPCFGTPVELGDAMRKAGFNVITCATNHAFDKGAQGIKDTVNYWEKYKDTVLMTGIYKDQESYDNLTIGEYNGIKIAFLNYTTLINSGAKREPYYIKYYKESLAEKEIKKAKKMADVVIVFPHWGVEYTHEQNSEQEHMAKKMAEAGADIIIGCHPHVVQPMKVIKTKDGRRVPCYYSLGNFVSNMFWIKTQLEGIAELEIVKWNGKTEIKTAKFIPLVNYIGDGDKKFSAYLLSDFTKDVYQKHYLNTRSGWLGVTYDSMMKLFKSIGNEKY